MVRASSSIFQFHDEPKEEVKLQAYMGHIDETFSFSTQYLFFFFNVINENFEFSFLITSHIEIN